MVAHPPPLPLMIMTPPTDEQHSSSADHHHMQLQDSSSSQQAQAILMKRKRTKRPRHPPSSSSGESTTTEEEDMAHCLILLAQGAGSDCAAVVVDSKPSTAPQPAVVDSKPPSSPQQPAPPPASARTERYSSRKYTEAAATPDGARAGFYVYECRTCNKCFPTFQALGGHRASHKKPRLATGGAEDDGAAASTKPQHGKPPTTTTTAAASPPPHPLQQPHIDVVAVFRPDVATALSLNTATSSSVKLRVHECSICGAEFGSGQALGGHMRRHRPLNNAPAVVATTADTSSNKKEATTSINLELDLNLPAPSDEESGGLSSSLPAVMLGLGKFNGGNKAAGLVLTATALVDCHY
ncbi:hypothetical protein BS78_04G325700 [Paspalum vaginatum]|nr:hypothetical protein BS78_04G325700 [Paspalum vaginatum]